MATHGQLCGPEIKQQVGKHDDTSRTRLGEKGKTFYLGAFSGPFPLISNRGPAVLSYTGPDLASLAAGPAGEDLCQGWVGLGVRQGLPGEAR